MADQFSKDVIVAWEDVVSEFADAEVMSQNVTVRREDPQRMFRANDEIWIPTQPIARSFTGLDATTTIGQDWGQFAVRGKLGFQKHAGFDLDGSQLRDMITEGTFGKACATRLASDINVAVLNTASEGTMFVKRNLPAAGFKDVAACDTIMNIHGVPGQMRRMALGSAEYNGMADNLATRQTLQTKTQEAYEKGLVGRNIANFDIYKLDYANRLTNALGTGVTISGANQFYTPKATSTATSGETANVDNRYQNIVVNVTAGTIKIGDCFIVAGVNSVHHITKGDTGTQKTFRIHAIVAGTGGAGANTIQISPPFISAQGATNIEEQYKNVTATPANGAVITFLNTLTANINPFWTKDAIQLIAGNYRLPDDNVGLATRQATTKSGIPIRMTKYSVGDKLSERYRFDIFFGVVNVSPEQSGVMLFEQP